MKWMNNVSVLVGVTLGLVVSTAAAADTGAITAFVEKTLVTNDSSRGGCMVALTEDPSKVLPACRKTWVSFSCDGTYTDPVRAYRMLDQAQLSLATGLLVQITFTDEKMHEGYCVATKIKVMTE